MPIMVLFLFVIMLLGAEQTGRMVGRWWMQPAALLLGGAFLVELVVVMVNLFSTSTEVTDLPAGFGSPVAVGEILFTRYVLPFEATAILLLIAMIGAIVLTRPEKH
jgi:NADH-quinone oxidoreductase subunit J